VIFLILFFAFLAWTISSAQASESPKLTAHLCKGTLIDQRSVGISLGDCDLNDLGGGDLDQIKTICGEPHGVDDDRKGACRVCGYVEQKADLGGVRLVEPVAVAAGNGKFSCVWRGD
jgi:hypothetical protein